MMSINRTHLYFLRHCSTENNNRNIITGSLNISICSNASLDYTEIKSFDNLMIISSPLRRCRETVDLMKSNAKIKNQVIYCTKLVERSMGIFEGLNRKEVVYDYPCFFDENKFIYFLTPPRGESFYEISSRADIFVNCLIKLLKKNDVLICSHNQIMKILYFKLKKIDLQKNWNKINFLNGKVYTIF
jgi:broad specificity phosphatase PhoE